MSRDLPQNGARDAPPPPPPPENKQHSVRASFADLVKEAHRSETSAPVTNTNKLVKEVVSEKVKSDQLGDPATDQLKQLKGYTDAQGGVKRTLESGVIYNARAVRDGAHKVSDKVLETAHHARDAMAGTMKKIEQGLDRDPNFFPPDSYVGRESKPTRRLD